MLFSTADWEDALRERGLERAPGQLDWLKATLGPSPAPEELPGAFAFWAAALVNQMPSLGAVGAPEVRPAVLMEPTTLGRLRLVLGAASRSATAVLGRRTEVEEGE